MAAQDVQVDIVSTGLWPQGDERDPLGVWGGRTILTATGVEAMKVRFSPSAALAGAYLYTCQAATIAGLTAAELANGKIRLLTNWPDIDPAVGVQGYGSVMIIPIIGTDNFTAPFDAPSSPLVQADQRYILLFDPRPVAGAFDIVEVERDRGVLNRTYAFEAWGYFWDRSILQAPGGPRHPGSS